MTTYLPLIATGIIIGIAMILLCWGICCIIDTCFKLYYKKRKKKTR